MSLKQIIIPAVQIMHGNIMSRIGPYQFVDETDLPLFKPSLDTTISLMTGTSSKGRKSLLEVIPKSKHIEKAQEFFGQRIEEVILLIAQGATDIENSKTPFVDSDKKFPKRISKELGYAFERSCYSGFESLAKEFYNWADQPNEELWRLGLYKDDGGYFIKDQINPSFSKKYFQTGSNLSGSTSLREK